MPEAASNGGRGRKLQDPVGRFDTRVKISEIKRCWMLVSYMTMSSMRPIARGGGQDGFTNCV